MGSKKFKKLVNNRKETHSDIENKLAVTSGKGREVNIVVEK